jgi:cytochrome c oxidase assembly protein subunit 15
VAKQISPKAYARTTLIALGLLITITISGALVRLTGSGLGCPDWPTCANGKIVAPLEGHAMIEFVNRVFTGAVALGVIAAVLLSFFRNPRRRDLTWLSVSLVIGVIAQAIVGGLVVLLELAPVSVIAHFALSMILNMAAFVLWRRARNVSDSYPTRVPPSTRLLARFTIAATVVALAAGTIVTGTGPHAGDDRAARLNLDLIWTIRVHSAAVWTLLVLVLLTIRSVFRAQDPQLRVAMRAPMTMLLAVLLAQGALGYVQYFMGVPAVLVAFHVAGSIAVWLAVLRFALPLVSRPSINLRSEVDLRTSAQSTTDQLAPHTR